MFSGLPAGKPQIDAVPGGIPGEHTGFFRLDGNPGAFQPSDNGRQTGFIREQNLEPAEAD
jgi:hypothetical protein